MLISAAKLRYFGILPLRDGMPTKPSKDFCANCVDRYIIMGDRGRGVDPRAWLKHKDSRKLAQTVDKQISSAATQLHQIWQIICDLGDIITCANQSRGFCCAQAENSLPLKSPNSWHAIWERLSLTSSCNEIEVAAVCSGKFHSSATMLRAAFNRMMIRCEIFERA